MVQFMLGETTAQKLSNSKALRYRGVKSLLKYRCEHLP
jgi:hypothetical protein